MNTNPVTNIVSAFLLLISFYAEAESKIDKITSSAQYIHYPLSQKKAADVIVIGAGISGLSAAIEAADQGLSVLMLDMYSVYGGHGVMAAGVLNIPVTPDQQAKGINDSYDLAIKDFETWGEDVNRPWVEYYVKNARREIYDWVTEMGVSFFRVVQPAGNSVRRVHVPEGFGLNLVTSIYRKALSFKNIVMIWNTRADDLIVKNKRVVGVNTTHMRSKRHNSYFASAVIIATGGFQSNIQRVLENWPEHLNKPSRILAGSGLNSMGSGLDLAEGAGARLYNLDYQWNYVTGIPNPGFKQGVKGLSYFPFPGKPRYDIWVNDEGMRFTNECDSAKVTLPKVLAQPNQRYWSVFDSQNIPNMTISGPGWTRERMHSDIYSNPEITKVANSLPALAKLMGVPIDRLKQSVQSYNQHVEEGADNAFGRFGSASSRSEGKCSNPIKLETRPYYAVRLFPLARKSMGGIKIDMGARVLDDKDRSIPGLYAVGEAAGLAGINGKAGLEGTFLGPSIVTGRVAGRTIGAEVAREVSQIVIKNENFTVYPKLTNVRECTGCHQLERQIQQGNTGYKHFGFVHELVLDRQLPCQACHSDLYPYNPVKHKWDKQIKTHACVICHGGGD